MTTALAGTETTLVARFEADGTAADPQDPIQLTVTSLAGGTPVVDTTNVGHPATGTFTYVWSVPEVLEVTDYLVIWDPAGDDVSASEVVQVFPVVTHSWATVAQVLGFTAQEVTPADIQMASGIITLYGNANMELADDYAKQDLYWLAAATAYQTVWMKPKADTLLQDRESHASTSADGVQVARKADSDIMLAPLAARALRNLSWIGGRTDVPPRTRKGYNFLAEQDDHMNAWMSGRAL
jgi:hypothetical protein